MPEFRRDPITGRWVIIAPRRGERPLELAANGASGGFADLAGCPFCPGHEGETPDTVDVVPAADGSAAWQIRVVPNKFPAVELDATLATNLGGVGAFPAVGVHEVIIESPRHITRTAELSRDELRQVFHVYRRRITAWSGNERIDRVIVFKNEGAAAGASIAHLHSQLIGLSDVPGGWTAFPRDRCLVCDALQVELNDKTRVVRQSERLVVFCPFASGFAFETWIVPRKHVGRFDHCDDTTVDELADATGDVLARLDRNLDRPEFNYILHTASFDSGETDAFHWRLQIIPRTAQLAGFELGLGALINPTSPEEAADRLRGAAT